MHEYAYLEPLRWPTPYQVLWNNGDERFDLAREALGTQGQTVMMEGLRVVTVEACAAGHSGGSKPESGQASASCPNSPVKKCR